MSIWRVVDALQGHALGAAMAEASGLDEPFRTVFTSYVKLWQGLYSSALDQLRGVDGGAWGRMVMAYLEYYCGDYGRASELLSRIDVSVLEGRERVYLERRVHHLRGSVSKVSAEKEEEYRMAVSLAVDGGFYFEAGNSCVNWGMHCYYGGDFRRSVELHRRAGEYFERAGNGLGRGVLLANLGIIRL